MAILGDTKATSLVVSGTSTLASINANSTGLGTNGQILTSTGTGLVWSSSFTGNLNGISNGGIYLTSSTAAATAAKTASYTNFSLLTGSSIYIKFSETNTANNPTLNVNNTGTKAIFYKGARVIYQGLASGIIYHMIYDGTYWQIVNSIIPLTGTCTTASGESAKTVICPGFILYTGATVKVKFQQHCYTLSLTLNVNNTGAKPIYWLGATNNLHSKLTANTTYEFVYDGTNYNLVSDTFDHYTSSGSSGGNETLVLGNSTDYQATGGMRGRFLLFGTGANYTTIYAQANGNREVYLPNYAGNMYLIHAQSNDAVGTSSKPVYIAANGRVEQGSTYAGGTAVTLNGTSKGASTASFYAPTAAGTANQVLASSGTSLTPVWKTLSTISIGSASAGTAIDADDITSWSAGTAASASYANGILTISNGTAPSLSYSSKSIPNISVSSKTVATGSLE